MNFLSFQISRTWFYPTCPICPHFQTTWLSISPPQFQSNPSPHGLSRKTHRCLYAFIHGSPHSRNLLNKCLLNQLCARHCSRLLEYISEQTDENPCLHETDRLEWMSFFLLLSLLTDLSLGGPAQVPSSYPEWGPSHTDCFIKPYVYHQYSTLKHTDIF